MKISQTVFALQSGHDFVTDGRTDRLTDDQGKNNMSPNPTWGGGGDVMNIHEYANELICILEYQIKRKYLRFY